MNRTSTFPPHWPQPVRRSKSERGISLLLTTLCITVMVAMLGLSFDLGRMYIVKNELQAYADAAAMGAVVELDGTRNGLVKANTIASQGPLGSSVPNGYDFGSRVISQVSVQYATAYSGTYTNFAGTSSAATNTYRFVKVTASAPVSIYFLGVLPNVSSSQTLAANALAGQQYQDGFSNGGLMPFSPDAHNASDTRNFGLTPGLQYTLKWGNGNSTGCAGDNGFNPGNAPSQHGFVDIGQDTNSNSSLRETIISNNYPNPNSTPSTIEYGTVLDGIPGNRGGGIFSAVATRAAEDTDQVSTTYAQYQSAGTGNRRRVVVAAINDPALAQGNGNNATVTVIGFGAFLLAPSSSITGNSGSLCAEYIGPASLTQTASGGTNGKGVYAPKLYQ